MFTWLDVLRMHITQSTSFYLRALTDSWHKRHNSYITVWDQSGRQEVVIATSHHRGTRRWCFTCQSHIHLWMNLSCTCLPHWLMGSVWQTDHTSRDLALPDTITDNGQVNLSVAMHTCSQQQQTVQYNVWYIHKPLTGRLLDLVQPRWAWPDCTKRKKPAINGERAKRHVIWRNTISSTALTWFNDGNSL